MLVVDDDPVACRATAEMLAQAGYAVEWTCDPVEALERLRRSRYALVVSDVQMPGLRGTALAAEVACMRRATKVLLLSASVDARTATEAAALGVPLVRKPATVEALLEAAGVLTAAEDLP